VQLRWVLAVEAFGSDPGKYELVKNAGNDAADEDKREALAAARRRFFAGGTDNECTGAGVLCSVLNVRADVLLAFSRL